MFFVSTNFQYYVSVDNLYDLHQLLSVYKKAFFFFVSIMGKKRKTADLKVSTVDTDSF